MDRQRSKKGRKNNQRNKNRGGRGNQTQNAAAAKNSVESATDETIKDQVNSVQEENQNQHADPVPEIANEAPEPQGVDHRTAQLSNGENNEISSEEKTMDVTIENPSPSRMVENNSEELKNGENIKSNTSDHTQLTENQLSDAQIQNKDKSSKELPQEPISIVEYDINNELNVNEEAPANVAEQEKRTENPNSPQQAINPEMLNIAENYENTSEVKNNYENDLEQTRNNIKVEYETKLSQELFKAQEIHALELKDLVEIERSKYNEELDQTRKQHESEMISKNNEILRLTEQLDALHNAAEKNNIDVNSDTEELKNQLIQARSQNGDLQGAIKKKEENEQNQAVELDKLKEGLTTLRKQIAEFDQEKKRNEEALYEKEVEFENQIKDAKDYISKLVEENKQIKDELEQEKQKSQEFKVRI